MSLEKKQTNKKHTCVSPLESILWQFPWDLEIWPYKHYSPIYDHGNAYAITKVIRAALMYMYTTRR